MQTAGDGIQTQTASSQASELVVELNGQICQFRV